MMIHCPTCTRLCSGAGSGASDPVVSGMRSQFFRGQATNLLSVSGRP